MKNWGTSSCLSVFSPLSFHLAYYRYSKQTETFHQLKIGRSLKTALTKEALLTGSFFKDVETYTNDQLIGRDELIKNYTIAQINMGKSLINDIILTDDKWLLKTRRGQKI